MDHSTAKLRFLFLFLVFLCFTTSNVHSQECGGHGSLVGGQCVCFASWTGLNCTDSILWESCIHEEIDGCLSVYYSDVLVSGDYSVMGSLTQSGFDYVDWYGASMLEWSGNRIYRRFNKPLGSGYGFLVSEANSQWQDNLLLIRPNSTMFDSHVQYFVSDSSNKISATWHPVTRPMVTFVSQYYNGSVRVTGASNIQYDLASDLLTMNLNSVGWAFSDFNVTTNQILRSNWISVKPGVIDPRVCHGEAFGINVTSTDSGRIVIDMNHCNFPRVPVVFNSLVSDCDLGGVSGANHIIDPSELEAFIEIRGSNLSTLVSGCNITSRWVAIIPDQNTTCTNGTNSLLCSGTGSCLLDSKKRFGTCLCDQGWTGPSCEIAVTIGCNAHFHNSSSACSNHGNCGLSGKCSCLPGYDGSDCENYSCFGVLSNNSSVCGGRGYCADLDSCICDPNFSGYNCENYSCFGILKDDEAVCSGRGACIQPDNCMCSDVRYYGTNCEQFSCFNISESNSTVCSGNGICLHPNNCSCISGYYGVACENVSCYDIPFDSHAVCSGNGQCISLDQCLCREGRFGMVCESFSCFNISSRNNTVCSRNGVCQDANHCVCNESYTGEDCSDPVCFGTRASDPLVCSGRGSCVGPDTCVDCSFSVGDKCEHLIRCFGVQSSNRLVCSGHGSCSSTDICNCHTSWTGKDCSIPLCGSKNSTDPLVCSGRGSCVSPDHCVCKSNDQGHWSGQYCETCSLGYQGKNCTEAFCNSTVCSNKGSCTTLNTCDCYSNSSIGQWSGVNCEKCLDNYYGLDCLSYCDPVRSCSGHGYCSPTGECSCFRSDNLGHFIGPNCSTCYPGYYGQFCQNSAREFKFSSRGDRLVGQFTHAARYLPQTKYISQIDCAMILDDISLNLVGTGARCIWPVPESASFEIIFGENANFNIGNSLVVDILVTIGSVSLGKRFQQLVVLPPASGVTPPAAMINAPLSIGQCDDLILDGSSSGDYTRRSLIYGWKVLSGTGTAAMNQYLIQHNTSRVTVPSEFLTPGDRYVFQLIVTNFMNISSKISQVSIEILQQPAPMAQIVGPQLQEIFPRQFFKLEGRTLTSSCFSNTSDIIYSWSQTTGTLVSGQATGKNLLFPPGSFQATGVDTTYEFVLTTSIKSNPSVYTRKSVTVLVKTRSLVAVISGGNFKQAVSSPLILDASSSYDPDGVPSAATYKWYCFSTITNGLCNLDAQSEAILSTNANKLSLPASFFPPGRYRFELLFTKEARSSSAQTTIELVENSVPIVTIYPVVEKVDPAERLVLRSSVSTSKPDSAFRLRWSVVSGDLALTKHTIDSPIDRKLLSIRANTLTEGQRYTLRLEATDEEGTGSSEITIVVNSAPNVGLFSVNPPVTHAFSPIELSCSQFSDDDGPLLYLFGYLNENSRFIPFNIRPSLSNRYQVQNSPPGNGPSNEITFAVKVFDSYGASTLSKEMGIAKPYSPTNQTELIAFLNNQVKDLRYMEAEDIANIATTLPSLLSKSGNNSYASQLRESIVTSLVDSYQKDVTPSSKFSLEKVTSAIEIILSDPNQNTGDTIVTSRNFVSAVLDEIVDAKKYSLTIIENIGNTISNWSSTISLKIATNTETFSMKNVTQSTEMITKVTSAMLANAYSGVEGQEITTSTFSAVVMKEQPTSLDQLAIRLNNDEAQSQNTTIMLPVFNNSYGGVADIFSGSDDVGIRVIINEFNAYFHSASSENITTPVLSLQFLSDSGEVYPVSNLSEPIIFILTVPDGLDLAQLNFNESEAGLRPVCKYWDTRYSAWNSTGCTTINVTETTVTCACTHTTDFSAFVDYVVPSFNVLTRDDWRNIVNLNKDNMLTAAVISVMAGVYILLVIFVLLLKYFIFRSTNQIIEESQKTENKKENGIVRSVLEEFKSEHLYLSMFFKNEGKEHFSLIQKLTCVYISILGCMTGNALTFGQDVKNETQWIVSSIVAELCQAPITIMFIFLFVMTAPRAWKRTTNNSESLQSAIADETEIPDVHVVKIPSADSEIVVILHPHSLARDDLTTDSRETTLLSKSSKLAYYINQYKEKREVILDKLDGFAGKISLVLTDWFSRITWQSSVFIVLLTILYFGMVVGIVFIVPLVFDWFKGDHQVGLGVFFAIVYFVSMEVIYLRLRFSKFKQGEVPSWKLTRFGFVLAGSVIVIAGLVVIAMIPVITLVTPKKHKWYIKNIIIVVGTGIIMIAAIVWCIVLSRPWNREDVLDEDEYDSIIMEEAKSFPISTNGVNTDGTKKSNKKWKALFYYVAKYYNSPFWFPWWFLIIIYGLAAVYIVLCSYCLVLYGIKFDSHKDSHGIGQSKSWLLGSGVGVTQDIFLKGPIEFLFKNVLLILMVKFLDTLFFVKRRVVQESVIQEQENNENLRDEET